MKKITLALCILLGLFIGSPTAWGQETPTQSADPLLATLQKEICSSGHFVTFFRTLELLRIALQLDDKGFEKIAKNPYKYGLDGGEQTLTQLQFYLQVKKQNPGTNLSSWLAPVIDNKSSLKNQLPLAELSKEKILDFLNKENVTMGFYMDIYQLLKQDNTYRLLLLNNPVICKLVMKTMITMLGDGYWQFTYASGGAQYEQYMQHTLGSWLFIAINYYQPQLLKEPQIAKFFTAFNYQEICAPYYRALSDMTRFNEYSSSFIRIFPLHFLFLFKKAGVTEIKGYYSQGSGPAVAPIDYIISQEIREWRSRQGNKTLVSKYFNRLEFEFLTADNCLRNTVIKGDLEYINVLLPDYIRNKYAENDSRSVEETKLYVKEIDSTLRYVTYNKEKTSSNKFYSELSDKERFNLTPNEIVRLQDYEKYVKGKYQANITGAEFFLKGIYGTDSASLKNDLQQVEAISNMLYTENNESYKNFINDYYAYLSKTENSSRPRELPITKDSLSNLLAGLLNETGYYEPVENAPLLNTLIAFSNTMQHSYTLSLNAAKNLFKDYWQFQLSNPKDLTHNYDEGWKNATEFFYSSRSKSGTTTYNSPGGTFVGGAYLYCSEEGTFKLTGQIFTPSGSTSITLNGKIIKTGGVFNVSTNEGTFDAYLLKNKCDNTFTLSLSGNGKNQGIYFDFCCF